MKNLIVDLENGVAANGFYFEFLHGAGHSLKSRLL